MNEVGLQWLVLARLGILVGWAFCYSLGGLGIPGGKLWRRVGGSVVLAGGTIGISRLAHSFCVWFLMSPLIYFLVLSMGYGVNDDNPDASLLLWRKVRRRAWYGLCLGLCSLSFCHSWATLSLALSQTCLACVVSVVLGVSGWLDARSEETLIGLLSACVVPFMV